MSAFQDAVLRRFGDDVAAESCRIFRLACHTRQPVTREVLQGVAQRQRHAWVFPVPVGGDREGTNIRAVIEDLNLYLRGWFGYYRMSEVKQLFEELDQWIRHHIRKLMWIRWKEPKTRAEKLRHLGVSDKEAKIATSTGRGSWCSSRTPAVNGALNQGLRSRWGLVSLVQMQRRLGTGGLNRRIRNRTYGGVGAWGERSPRLPDHESAWHPFYGKRQALAPGMQQSSRAWVDGFR